jgi:hypothetical protein
MSATQIQDALAGEGLIGIEPALLQQGNGGWLQRLNLFTGRTLSDTALTNEQAYRGGRLTLLGQAVTQGTVQGLEISVDLTQTDPVLLVTPGYGIAATGQDVTLNRAMHTTVSSLAVIDGQSGAFINDFKTFISTVTKPWAGVILLQAIVADVPGSVVDSGSANIIVSGNLDASCDQDPAEYAFGDSQIVDGARLVVATWPSTSPTLALPSALPAGTWRNRLVYTIFNAELALAPDDHLPWEFLGVPLGVGWFDAASKLQFLDRFAVVRTGGLPRRRYTLPSADGKSLAAVQPALANARVNQLAEQLGEDLTPTSPPGLIAGEFALLPPVGVLPPYTMDFVNGVALWCPSNWTVSAAPIHTEELEGALQAGMTEAALDTARNETIEILVPLPDAVFDPYVLVTEQLDPIFQQEVDAATLARNIVLQHRKIIQLEENALAIPLNLPAIDLNAGLTADEIAGRDGPPVVTPNPNESFGTTLLSTGAYTSTDIQNLQATAAAVPYTVTAGGVQIPLFNSADWADLQQNGLQHFIDRINAKLAKANDLMDLAFLSSQTDIYRYKQNVLDATEATRLAVSPILANIATGVTAAATAQNIRDYLTSIRPPSTTPPPTTTTPAPTTTQGVVLEARLTAGLTNVAASPVLLNKLRPAAAATSIAGKLAAAAPIAAKTAAEAAAFTPLVVGTLDQPATPEDVTQQLPIVGAQLNLRTLTITERLSPSPAQEGLFYSVGNRVSILQLLALLEITIDDIPILVDNLPAGTAQPIMADLRPGANPARTQLVLNLVNNPTLNTPPQLNTNPDESGLFSTGIHVLEQHTQLLRAIEARIQLYRDFLSLCATDLNNIKGYSQSALTLLTQLQNDLTQSRQNLAFVAALLADEQARISSVNATRANVLKTYVQFIAYTRPPTVVDVPDAPGRQLTPANVTSPVPACLKQSVAVPPELREMVSLLREAPVSWFPPIRLQILKLERPNLLMDLATTTQTRAAAQLQLPLQVSSAASSTGVYASAISSIYSAGQQTFRTFQTQRASFQPAQIANQSWTAQVNVLQGVTAVADLLNSASVHTEIVNAASRAMQQISSVATCLYTRIGTALPIDRLQWAQFLSANSSLSLRSLAVLPGWNSQPYIDRQQMQLLVDWLFQQIDPSDQTANALMSDLIAVAILLASHAPVDNIIAGAVALRTKPVVGNPVRLTLPSSLVAHGMYVQLYSGGDLAARGVVTDLDSTGVTATVTDVYKPDATLQANDVAHFTALDPNALVFKAFSN